MPIKREDAQETVCVRVATEVIHVARTRRGSTSCYCIKVKVKLALKQTMKAQRGSRSVALLWVVNATPRPLYPRERNPIPIV